jgi:acyl-[acyl-carrier-protein] desaturase
LYLSGRVNMREVEVTIQNLLTDGGDIGVGTDPYKTFTKAYKLFFQKCLELDSSNALLAFHDMMRTKITMPAVYMRERGKALGETFKKFSNVAERSGIYTPLDYANILDNLLESWDIQHLKGLSDKAEAAQQYLCSLPERYRKVADRFAGRLKPEDYEFSWLQMVQAEPKPIAG